jgi:hypothetical protein
LVYSIYKSSTGRTCQSGIRKCYVLVPIYRCSIWGTYKVRNEIETKRNEINENETKRNQRNGNEMKRNQRKQNEIDWYEENGRKKIKDKTK